MKDHVKEGTEKVTIRTTDKAGKNFIDITLVVENKEIKGMFGLDSDGQSWQVRGIKFSGGKKSSAGKESSGGKESNDNDECKCCQFDAGLGRVVCVTCDC